MICSTQRNTHTTNLSISKDRQARLDNPRLLADDQRRRPPSPRKPRPDALRSSSVKLMVKHSHVLISKSEIGICPLTPGKGRRGQKHRLQIPCPARRVASDNIKGCGHGTGLYDGVGRVLARKDRVRSHTTAHVCDSLLANRR
jgi:hypothetical protein